MSDDFKTLPGMKERELGPCALCGKPLLDAGPVFYRVTLEQAALDRRAVERQLGLGMITGSAAIAAVLGPDEDLAKIVQTSRGLACAACITLPALAFLDVKKKDQTP
jgi:hypothetical protein